MVGNVRNGWRSGRIDQDLGTGIRAEHQFLTIAKRGCGKRLYVSRVFRPLKGEYPTGKPENEATQDGSGNWEDGHARAIKGGLAFRARYPGAYGNFRLQVTVRSGRDILGRTLEKDPSNPGKTRPGKSLGALSDRDVVWIRNESASPASPPSPGDVYIALRDLDESPFPWKFSGAAGSPIASPLTESSLNDLLPGTAPDDGDSVRVVTLTLTVLDARGAAIGTWSDLAIDPGHRTANVPDSLFDLFGEGTQSRGLPIVASAASALDGLDVLEALFGSIAGDLSDGDKLAAGITTEIVLQGGNDGLRPGAVDYEGKDDPTQSYKTGLKQFEAIEDISIVAAPGSTWNYYHGYQDDANTIFGLLLAHAQTMRYRIAVLDCAPKQTVADVRGMRAKIDSKYGALYFPWVKVLDPITRQLMTLPPSGFVAGIYARNDINRAVYKAPANEVANLALGFELMISKAQQEVLNPEGVNCFRFFEGRGMLLWGARTVSSDPEWKYVNLRRYFAYLERSIDRGTQWAVFEPNGERLWANVRRTIEDFLLNEWQMGALLGDKPEKAYFVRCDRTTMTQNDLDNGRMVCLIGVAALKPAEFVVFRIGQWTADQKV